MNFEDAFEEFKIYAEKRHKKQGFITLLSDFNSKIIPYFEGKSIFDLTRKDVFAWQNSIYSLNLKNSYASKLYIEFSVFMQFCCDFYGIDSNPVKEVGNFKKKFEDKKVDFYTLPEFRRFIKYVEHPVYKQFFNIMFFTGTRPGEAMALKFSDLQGDYLSITKNLTTKGGRNFDTPKNQSSIRKIRIDKRLKRDLLKLKKFYIKKYGIDDDYFILGGVSPLSPTSITRYKKKACKRANMREITLHQFRHSHASLLCDMGIPLSEISRRLGHSRLSTTADVYIHPDLRQEKRVFNTLNSIRFNVFITLLSAFKKY